MRDLRVAAVIFGAIPLILGRPYIGVLVWSLLGYMNPHRLTFGWAYDFPFAQVIAIVTLVAIVFSTEPKRIPFLPIVKVWVLFILWMNVTTYFALEPAAAILEWERMLKIQLISFITLMLITNRERLDLLVWTIAIALGFYGLKGGVFSILTGGQYLVFGPDLSFIEDNNDLALALVMILPLMRYLHLEATKRYLKWGLLIAMGLTALSILTSHSRGALLAITAMGVFMLLKSPYKFRAILVTVVLLPIMLVFMPDAWFDRMATIGEYQQDESALGRINAWWFAWNIALEHPLIGGGFNTFTPELFRQYAPNPKDFHDAHSIYFEVLGEQGFVGLALFLLLGFMAIRMGSKIIKQCKKISKLHWARNLAAMLQVSIIGYATGGAFLGLAYFDLYYHLIAMMVITRVIVDKQLENISQEDLSSISEDDTVEVFPQDKPALESWDNKPAV